jgi:hypothetical protein
MIPIGGFSLGTDRDVDFAVEGERRMKELEELADRVLH